MQDTAHREAQRVSFPLLGQNLTPCAGRMRKLQLSSTIFLSLCLPLSARTDVLFDFPQLLDGGENEAVSEGEANISRVLFGFYTNPDYQPRK